MYSFEGEFRRVPQQNLAGASKQEEREELLNRAQEDRLKREEQRRRQKSIICIQAMVRSFLARQEKKAEERVEFDTLVKLLGPAVPEESLLTVLLQKLLFFYNKQTDFNRLMYVSRHILRYSEHLMVNSIKDAVWQYRLHKLLCFNLNLFGLSYPRDSIATPLRLIEVLTSRETVMRILPKEEITNLLLRVFRYLISRGYMAQIRLLLDTTTPPLLRASPSSPTPLAGCLLDMVLRPLDLHMQATDFNFSFLLMEELCRNMFCKEMTEPIKLFLLPALSVSPLFPFQQMVKTLNNTSLPANTWLLHSFLFLEQRHTFSASSEFAEFLQVLASLSTNYSKLSVVQSDSSEDDSDSETEDSMGVSKEEIQTLEECVELLNERTRVQGLLQAIDGAKGPGVLQAVCQVCHNLLMSHKLAVHKYKLLYMLALQRAFLRDLWTAILSVTQISLFGSPTPLLNMISKGLAMTQSETLRIVPLLATFCSLFSLLVATLHDAEFYKDDDIMVSGSQTMPFSLSELVGMSVKLKEVSLGLVELAFPDSRPSVKDQYKSAVHPDEEDVPANTAMWAHLFKVCVALMRQLYSRDLRRQFCPDGHWISPSVILTLDSHNSDATIRRRTRLRQHYRPFHAIPAFTREELEEGPPLSTKEIRTLTILRELPFVISFHDRVLVFYNLVFKDKMVHQATARNFLQGPFIQIAVRRNYLYEDAFEKLSPENEPELRLVMRVQLVSAVGLAEAGVDGGGVFREFLTELLKTAFDPNRGFFRLTKDNLLYPNPHVHLIHQDFPKHYYFIGRILGKALYENLLVELPLAEFFLSKIVGRYSDVDVHHLASLDPIMYRNLLYLKNYEGDVADLGLDFTAVNDEFGETTVDELKPNGGNIPVTPSNRIEYIHLVADYKLNRQIRAQCNAFKQGLANVIPLDWLQTFSNKELQVLISGAEIPVDLEDLRHHTNYSGGYTPDHPTIKIFWQVMDGFNDNQRRQLLKFVTSCSRPPLLGFKELDPPFCIQYAGTSERLPTASTCMNLLKLPEFHEKNILKDKLLYAIQSGSGFELS